MDDLLSALKRCPEPSLIKVGYIWDSMGYSGRQWAEYALLWVNKQFRLENLSLRLNNQCDAKHTRINKNDNFNIIPEMNCQMACKPGSVPMHQA